MESRPPQNDLEFMVEFRETVEQYIRCIDAWEKEFQKRYTFARRAHEKLSPALEAANSAYITVRQKLEAGMPRARRIAFQHEVSAPFPALLRVPLGLHKNAFSVGSALGRNERLAILDALTQTIVACREKEFREEVPFARGESDASWSEVFQHLRQQFLGNMRKVLGRRDPSDLAR